jgi:hypothetical protein
MSKKAKTCCGLKDVDEVIAVGQPELHYWRRKHTKPIIIIHFSRKKKLYRDKEKEWLVVLLRFRILFWDWCCLDKIVLILLVLLDWNWNFLTHYPFNWGNTTSEKLEMTGEPVTYFEYRKKEVREEFENDDKFKNGLRQIR